MADPVRVEMFLDVSCPWCHGAVETNRRLLDELGADPLVPPLELCWRFMRLHPIPREGRPVPPEAEAQDEVSRYASSVGVRVEWSRYTWIHDPLTAHRLLAAVRDDGGDDLPGLWSLARVVFTANFVHGVDISDLAALRGAVERGGLAVAPRIWKELADDGHMAAVLADHRRALEVELDGVPRMYVNGRIVPTWIDPHDVRRQLREAVAAVAA